MNNYYIDPSTTTIIKQLLITGPLCALVLSSAAVQAENNLLGTGAGGNITSGDRNIFIGENAGNAVSSQNDNTFVGDRAGESNTATGNTFVGASAGLNTTTSGGNTFIGRNAGLSNISGNSNTFLGSQAGEDNTASGNTFLGTSTGRNTTTGGFNTFIGRLAGFNNTSGIQNIFLGDATGFANTGGGNNTFLGISAGAGNTTGSSNTFLGMSAGQGNITGTNNVFVGASAGRFETGSSKLYLEGSSSTTPLIYGDFLADIVGINGILGIGTQLPTSTLHVLRADGTAKVLVEETNIAVAPRTLFQLNNAGNTKFNINNTDAGVEWAFTNSGNDFRISRQGSGVVEFILTNNGDLTIQGALTQLSSRESKHQITKVDAEQVLKRVLALPIKEWSYKDSKAGVRHVGPMAEDFHQAFGLGKDASGIATLDTSGVALAAIQGLKAKQDAENLALKQQLLAQESELIKLRKVVQQLVAKDQLTSAD